MLVVAHFLPDKRKNIIYHSKIIKSAHVSGLDLIWKLGDFSQTFFGYTIYGSCGCMINDAGGHLNRRNACLK